jgi:hypothetical protein
MFEDIRDWYGMGYSPYTIGASGYHPYIMTGYHYPHHHHPHHYYHPHHDNVVQSQSVLINFPHHMKPHHHPHHMIHGMK